MEKMTLPEWMKGPVSGPSAACGARVHGFLEKSLDGFASVMRKTLVAESFSARDGALQRLEPRARLAGFLFLILAAAISKSWMFMLAVITLTVFLSIVTKVGIGPLLRRTLPAVLFMMVLAFPVLFGFVTPGTPLVGTGSFAITVEGVRSAFFFMMRVSSMAALASLAALTTSQAGFFRGLGGLLPAFFVTALFFTFRYALILVKTAEEAALGRKSRTICAGALAEAQGWFSSRAAFMLKRSLNLSEEIGMAMVSRGFDGRVRTVHSGRIGGRELLWLGGASFFLFLSFGF